MELDARPIKVGRAHSGSSNRVFGSSGNFLSSYSGKMMGGSASKFNQFEMRWHQRRLLIRGRKLRGKVVSEWKRLYFVMHMYAWLQLHLGSGVVVLSGAPSWNIILDPLCMFLCLGKKTARGFYFAWFPPVYRKLIHIYSIVKHWRIEMSCLQWESARS